MVYCATTGVISLVKLCAFVCARVFVVLLDRCRTLTLLSRESKKKKKLNNNRVKKNSLRRRRVCPSLLAQSAGPLCSRYHNVLYTARTASVTFLRGTCSATIGQNIVVRRDFGSIGGYESEKCINRHGWPQHFRISRCSSRSITV